MVPYNTLYIYANTLLNGYPCNVYKGMRVDSLKTLKLPFFNFSVVVYLLLQKGCFFMLYIHITCM